VIDNQLFKAFRFPARFCPSPFHMTMTRNGQWRNAAAMHQYLSNVSDVVGEWRSRGPTFLAGETDPQAPGFPNPVLGDELTKPHGIYLFRDRNTPMQYFAPNWPPPYNTTQKRGIIQQMLSEIWNPDTKSFEPAPWATPGGGGGTGQRCEAALEESCGLDRRDGGANSCVQCCGDNQLPLRAAGCTDSNIQKWCHDD
jgi:hypothetical protein